MTFDPRAFVDEAIRTRKAKAKPQAPAAELPQHFSDDGLALRFAAENADKLRYVATLGRWLIWDGTRWTFDETLKTRDIARDICRTAATECNHAKASKALASAMTVSATERLAQSDRRLALHVDQLDADIWVLNTPKGTVDLRTGEMRKHDQHDYITKCTAIAPDEGCPTPVWDGFLSYVTAGDQALVEYLQRVAGYALTGSTQAHALFFLYGRGANGKTTFLNVLTGCLADYCRVASIETFTASSHDRHPTDLAGLRGARLVTATETEEGRRWAESRIKQLTGGDPVSARFMRMDFFEYTPRFKLVIAGNHKPTLRSVDEAIARRFNLVPFTVTVPPEERDPEMPDKLRAEWPGILSWMIAGTADWLERGLAPPELVTQATADYLQAQDTIAAWLDEECERTANNWERSATLFASWKAWAERSGEFCGDNRRFRDRLEARGIFQRREPGTGQRGYLGVKLKPNEGEAAQQWWGK